MRESQIRVSLAAYAEREIEPSLLIEEFWVPRSHERVDMVALTRGFSYAFEIKSARDNLDRLPRQRDAYERLFDYCSVVVAKKHVPQILDMLPAWWGVFVVGSEGDESAITAEREPSRHDMLDESLLVRLLWKEEAAALFDGPEYQGLHRPALWRQVLNELDLNDLRKFVLSALISRDPKGSKIPNRRVTRKFPN